MEIWLNPACSKGRSAVRLWDAAGARYTVRRHLDGTAVIGRTQEAVRDAVRR